MFKSIVPALLVATILPTTLAKTCSAVGAMADNSVVGLGPQGVSNSVHLYDPDGNEIGSTDSNACTDLLYIEGDGLTDKFAWAASCNLTKFKECHGAYGTQTHIEGLEPKHDSEFYGVGIATGSQCKVEFEC